jgi:sensor domain CHASE-containing protein
MMNAMNIRDLTLLFLLTIFALAAAFVWMFCEAERHAGRRRARMAPVSRSRHPRRRQ